MKLLPTFTLVYKDRPGITHRKNTFIVRLDLDDTVASTITHLCLSLGLSGTQSKKLFVGKERLDIRKKASLKVCGVKEGDELMLQGFNTLKVLGFEIKVLVKMEDNTTQVRVRVKNTTTVFDLQHKLQDVTGIHVDDQFLTYKGHSIGGKKQRTVELYRNSSNQPCLMVLEWQPQILQHVPVRPLAEYGFIDEKDGPYLKLQGYDQSSRSIMPVPAVTSSGSPTLRSHSAVPYSADDTRKLKQETLSDLEREEFIGYVPDVQISEAGLLTLSDIICKWERLAVRLLIPRSEIIVIQKNYSQDYKEQKHQMLLTWKQRRGPKATWKEFMSAMLDENDINLAHEVVEIARQRKYSDSGAMKSFEEDDVREEQAKKATEANRAT